MEKPERPIKVAQALSREKSKDSSAFLLSIASAALTTFNLPCMEDQAVCSTPPHVNSTLADRS